MNHGVSKFVKIISGTGLTILLVSLSWNLAFSRLATNIDVAFDTSNRVNTIELVGKIVSYNSSAATLVSVASFMAMDANDNLYVASNRNSLNSIVPGKVNTINILRSDNFSCYHTIDLGVNKSQLLSTGLAVSGDGDKVFVSHSAGTLQTRDGKTGEVIFRYERNTNTIHPAGTVCSASTYNANNNPYTLTEYSAQIPTSLGTNHETAAAVIKALAVSPDGNFLYAAAKRASISVHDTYIYKYTIASSITKVGAGPYIVIPAAEIDNPSTGITDLIVEAGEAFTFSTKTKIITMQGPTGSRSTLHDEGWSANITSIGKDKYGNLYFITGRTVKIKCRASSGCELPVTTSGTSLVTNPVTKTAGTVTPLITSASVPEMYPASLAVSSKNLIFLGDDDDFGNTIMTSIPIRIIQGDTDLPPRAAATNPQSAAQFKEGDAITLSATFTAGIRTAIAKSRWEIASLGSFSSVINSNPEVTYSPATTPRTETYAAGTLAPGTTYHWRVRAVDNATPPQTGEYTATRTFYIEPKPPDPTLNTPEAAAEFFAKEPITLTATYERGTSPVIGPGTLTFQVCRDNTSDTACQNSLDGPVSTIPVTVAALQKDHSLPETLTHGTHSWRVKSVSASGLEGTYSGYRSFIIKPSPEPTPVTPANADVFLATSNIPLSATFTGYRTAPSNPITTEWQVCTDATCSATPTYTQTTTTNDGATPLKETHTIPAGTLAPGTYHWRARTYDELYQQGGSTPVVGGFSPIRTFSIHEYTQIPEVIIPSSVITTLTPELTASPFVAVATTPGHSLAETQWQICANMDCSDAANIIFDSAPTFEATGVPTSTPTCLNTSPVPTGILSPGRRYAVRVRYKDNLDQRTEFSTPKLLITSESAINGPPATITCTPAPHIQQPPTLNPFEDVPSSPSTVGTVLPDTLLSNPGKITIDSEGNLWVVDSGHHRLVSLTTKAINSGQTTEPSSARDLFVTVGNDECATLSCQAQQVANLSEPLFRSPRDIIILGSKGFAMVLDQSGTLIRGLCVDSRGCPLPTSTQPTPMFSQWQMLIDMGNGTPCSSGTCGDGEEFTTFRLSANTTALESDERENIFIASGQTVRGLASGEYMSASSNGEFYGLTFTAVPAACTTTGNYCDGKFHTLPIMPAIHSNIIDLQLIPGSSAAVPPNLLVATATEIYKVDPAGTSTKIAGTGQTCSGLCGMGGPALNADLGTIVSLHYYSSGTASLLYVGQLNGGIYEINLTTQVIRKIAGLPHGQNTVGSATGTGSTEMHLFPNPVGLFRMGNHLLVSDSTKNTVEAINLAPLTITGDSFTSLASTVHRPVPTAGTTSSFTVPASCTNCTLEVDELTVPTGTGPLAMVPKPNAISTAGLYTVTLIHPNRSTETKLIAVGKTLATSIHLGSTVYPSGTNKVFFSQTGTEVLASAFKVSTTAPVNTRISFFPYSGEGTPLWGVTPVILLSEDGSTYGTANVVIWPKENSTANPYRETNVEPITRAFVSATMSEPENQPLGTSIQQCLANYHDEFLNTSPPDAIKNDFELSKSMVHFCLKWLRRTAAERLP